MKIQFTFFIFLFFCYNLLSQSSSGLLARYDFNLDLQKDKDVIYDKSGNKNHGRINGNIEYAEDRFGNGCGALLFDGGTFVLVPNSRYLQKPQKAITISVWFKLNQGADFFREWITICCKGDQSIESYESPQYRMQATAQTISINTEFNESFIPQLKYETWYFYCYVFDGKSVKVFLNGNNVFETVYNSVLTMNDSPLEIGRDSPGAIEYFNGVMDDLSIYDVALNDVELSKLYLDKTGASNKDYCINQTIATNQNNTPSSNQPVILLSGSQPLDNTGSSNSNNNNVQVNQNDSYASLPTEIVGVPVNYQKTVEVKGQNITIYAFDNEKEDGDIVSININGFWVLERYTLKKKINPPTPKAMIKFTLKDGDSNYLVSKAWNLGSIPPNTLTIEINDGLTTQEVQINSEEGLNGGIKIILKK